MFWSYSASVQIKPRWIIKCACQNSQLCLKSKSSKFRPKSSTDSWSNRYTERSANGGKCKISWQNSLCRILKNNLFKIPTCIEQLYTYYRNLSYFCRHMFVNLHQCVTCRHLSVCICDFSYAARGTATLCGLSGVLSASNFLAVMRWARWSWCAFVSALMTATALKWWWLIVRT